MAPVAPEHSPNCSPPAVQCQYAATASPVATPQVDGAGMMRGASSPKPSVQAVALNAAAAPHANGWPPTAVATRQTAITVAPTAADTPARGDAVNVPGCVAAITGSPPRLCTALVAQRAPSAGN